MSVRTISTREFTCNHCRQVAVFDHDADAGRAGWALFNVNNREFALCPEHYRELKEFLHVDSFGPPLGSVQPQTPTGGPIADAFGPTVVPRGILGVRYPTNQE